MIRTASFRVLLTRLALAAIVPPALLLGYTLYSNAQQRVAEAKFVARTLATITAADVSHALEAKRDMLRQLSSRPAIRAMNAARCDQVLWELRQIFPEFANATTVDMRGIALCSAVPQPGGKPVDVSKAAWFKRTLAEENFVVGNPFFGPITSRWVSVLTFPVRDELNKMTGMLGFPVDLALFTPAVSTVPLIAATTVTIISAEGTIVWRNRDPEKWVGKNVADHASVKKILTIGQGDLEEPGIDGTERFFSVSPVAGADWRVAVGIPKEVVFAETRAIVQRNALIGILALLGMAALVLNMARRVERPVKSLLQTIREVKLGKRDVQAETGGPAEISEVADAVNQMLAVRVKAERRLESLLARQKDTEARLARSNADLQRFAEVAAHHLQEPVRRMASYAERLTTQLGDRIDDPEARLSLDFIEHQARRMKELLGDVERYLAADQPAGEVVLTDAKKAVGRVLSGQSARIAESGTRLAVGDLPEAWIDPPRLTDMFAVAIDNALRYGAAQGVITIDGERHGRMVRYRVTDTGPGIEAAYRERAFRVFEQLASGGEGTGIGLAILRRIAQSCGGDAWIEDAAGGGCRVVFELPAEGGA